MAKAGEPVTFTITVKNVGQLGAVKGYVQDSVPDYLAVLDVKVIGEHQGLKSHWESGQDVLVDTGILGQGAEVTILILTQVRQLPANRRLLGPQSTVTAQETPTPVLICVDNVAIFDADNCPRRTASVKPCLLPTTGALDRWWMLAAGLATSVLVLSLALSKKSRINWL
jgi:uncharacterized repeat protein (TIGR01451 family)